MIDRGRETIYKYPLQVTREQKIKMPANANPLCVQMQNGVPTLWCVVDTYFAEVEFSVFCIGTGHEMPGILAIYVGTVQLSDGTVWHYFIKRPLL